MPALPIAGSGDALELPLPPAGEPSETEAQRCARLQVAHRKTPPEKIEGRSAVLTPEGIAPGRADVRPV
jgi:hypothetical protein